MQARCGTRAAIIAHLEYGEPLDGVCVAADAAMRLEAERRKPYKPRWDTRDTPEVCRHRLEVLEAAMASWEAESPGPATRRRAASRSASSDATTGLSRTPTRRATSDQVRVSA